MGVGVSSPNNNDSSCSSKEVVRDSFFFFWRGILQEGHGLIVEKDDQGDDKGDDKGEDIVRQIKVGYTAQKVGHILRFGYASNILYGV